MKQKDAAVLNIKILLIILGVGFLTIGIVFWLVARSSGPKHPSAVMNVSAPDNSFNNHLTAKYKKTLQENDLKQVQIAEQRGNSSISTLVDDEPVSNKNNMPPQNTEYSTIAPVSQSTPKTSSFSYSDRERQNAMKMIGTLIGQWSVPRMSLQKTVTMNNTTKGTSKTASPYKASTETAPAAKKQKVLITKGTTCYAILNSVLNTDYSNTTVSATLLSCNAQGINLSGGTLFGKYKRNYDKVGVSFNLLNVNGQGYDINAIAIDEKTQQGILSGDVDHHYFARYILPSLTSIAKGWAEAGLRENTTVTTGINGTQSSQGAVSDTTKWVNAGSKAGDSLQKAVSESSKGHMISVKVIPKPNEGIGVVFLDNVVETKK